MSLEEMFDTNGWYVEEVDGELRYVTRDARDRAVVSTVHKHRRNGGRGRRSYRHPQPAQTDADATILLPTGEELGVPVEATQVRDATEGWRARWARRFKDREWHRAVQHAAVDVAMWSSMLALSAVVLKAAYFVVVL